MIFIEKRIIDFSKVQIYIYDLDLIEKMNVDYLNSKCVSKADYFRFIIEEYFRYKECGVDVEDDISKDIASINKNVSEILNKINNDDTNRYVKYISKTINELSESNKKQECVREEVLLNFNELIKFLVLIYNLGVASYNKGILSKGVSLNELLEDNKILEKFNFKLEGDSNDEP